MRRTFQPSAAGEKVCAQPLPFGAAQPHAGVVHQRGFVQRHVQPVAAAQRERRMRQRHFVQWRALIQVFVVDGLAGGNPPRLGRLRNGELGDFFVDDGFAQRGLRRK